MLLAAQYKTLAASTIVVSGRGKLLGYSVTESAGSPAAAAVAFYDGVSNGGTLMHNVRLAASGIANFWVGPQGINFNTGLFIGPLTGEMVGTVYFIAEELMGSHALTQSNGVDFRILSRISLHDVLQFINGAE